MKKLLAVVDFQRDAVEGSQGFEGAKQIEDGICRKIHQVRATGGKILFTLDTHYGEHWEKSNQESGKDLRSGWELYGKVALLRKAEDKVISKYMYASLDFCDYLLAEQFDEVEIVGLITNVCILCTAVAARMALPEARIVLDKTCITAPDESLHRQALAIMEGLKFHIEPKID